MSTLSLDKTNPSEIAPLNRADFGTAKELYQSFGAVVPSNITQSVLEDPRFWSFVSDRIKFGAECRVYDGAGTLYGLVYFAKADGFNVNPQVIYLKSDLKPSARHSESEKYITENRGNLGWCVVERETNTVVKERMPTKAAAEKELLDLKRALSR